MAKKKVEFPKIVYMEYPGALGENWTVSKQDELSGKSGELVGVYRLERTMIIKRVKRMVEQSVVELE